MSVSINQALVKQFEGDVHEAYQRMGSKLRSTVRSINEVKGSVAVFQKVGKGTAAIKSTHGMVPVMNIAHTSVECGLADYYAGDWVDKFDELKIMHDERAVIAGAGAYALGRKTDELIINMIKEGKKMAVQILAQMAVPMILEALKTGLQNIDHPAANGARTAIDELQASVAAGSIAPEQMAQMHAHIEKMADIDGARDQVSIAQINESLRTEIASTDPYVRRMRPTFGYMMAVTWGAQMIAVAYVIVTNPGQAGVVLNAMESLGTIWAVALSVMGIYMYQRSAEKRAGVNIPPIPISTLQKQRPGSENRAQRSEYND